MYKFITCPKTNKIYPVNSKKGKDVINKYKAFMKGGAQRSAEVDYLEKKFMDKLQKEMNIQRISCGAPKYILFLYSIYKKISLDNSEDTILEIINIIDNYADILADNIGYREVTPSRYSYKTQVSEIFEKYENDILKLNIAPLVNTKLTTKVSTNKKRPTIINPISDRGLSPLDTASREGLAVGGHLIGGAGKSSSGIRQEQLDHLISATNIYRFMSRRLEGAHDFKDYGRSDGGGNPLLLKGSDIFNIIEVFNANFFNNKGSVNTPTSAGKASWTTFPNLQGWSEIDCVGLFKKIFCDNISLPIPNTLILPTSSNKLNTLINRALTIPVNFRGLLEKKLEAVLKNAGKKEAEGFDLFHNNIYTCEYMALENDEGNYRLDDAGEVRHFFSQFHYFMDLKKNANEHKVLYLNSQKNDLITILSKKRVGGWSGGTSIDALLEKSSRRAKMVSGSPINQLTEILNESHINYHTMDCPLKSSIGNHLQALAFTARNNGSLQKLVPITNIWDPASSKGEGLPYNLKLESHGFCSGRILFDSFRKSSRLILMLSVENYNNIHIWYNKERIDWFNIPDSDCKSGLYEKYVIYDETYERRPPLNISDETRGAEDINVSVPDIKTEERNIEREGGEYIGSISGCPGVDQWQAMRYIINEIYLEYLLIELTTSGYTVSNLFEFIRACQRDKDKQFMGRKPPVREITNKKHKQNMTIIRSFIKLTAAKNTSAYEDFTNKKIKYCACNSKGNTDATPCITCGGSRLKGGPFVFLKLISNYLDDCKATITLDKTINTDRKKNEIISDIKGSIHTFILDIKKSGDYSQLKLNRYINLSNSNANKQIIHIVPDRLAGLAGILNRTHTMCGGKMFEINTSYIGKDILKRLISWSRLGKIKDAVMGIGSKIPGKLGNMFGKRHHERGQKSALCIYVNKNNWTNQDYQNLERYKTSITERSSAPSSSDDIFSLWLKGNDPARPYIMYNELEDVVAVDRAGGAGPSIPVLHNSSKLISKTIDITAYLPPVAGPTSTGDAYAPQKRTLQENGTPLTPVFSTSPPPIPPRLTRAERIANRNKRKQDIEDQSNLNIARGQFMTKKKQIGECSTSKISKRQKLISTGKKTFRNIKLGLRSAKRSLRSGAIFGGLYQRGGAPLMTGDTFLDKSNIEEYIGGLEVADITSSDKDFLLEIATDSETIDGTMAQEWVLLNNSQILLEIIDSLIMVYQDFKTDITTLRHTTSDRDISTNETLIKLQQTARIPIDKSSEGWESMSYLSHISNLILSILLNDTSSFKGNSDIESCIETIYITVINLVDKISRIYNSSITQFDRLLDIRVEDSVYFATSDKSLIPLRFNNWYHKPGFTRFTRDNPFGDLTGEELTDYLGDIDTATSLGWKLIERISDLGGESELYRLTLSDITTLNQKTSVKINEMLNKLDFLVDQIVYLEQLFIPNPRETMNQVGQKLLTYYKTKYNTYYVEIHVLFDEFNNFSFENNIASFIDKVDRVYSDFNPGRGARGRILSEEKAFKKAYDNYILDEQEFDISQFSTRDGGIKTLYAHIPIFCIAQSNYLGVDLDLMFDIMKFIINTHHPVGATAAEVIPNIKTDIVQYITGFNEGSFSIADFSKDFITDIIPKAQGLNYMDHKPILEQWTINITTDNISTIIFHELVRYNLSLDDLSEMITLDKLNNLDLFIDEILTPKITIGGEETPELIQEVLVIAVETCFTDGEENRLIKTLIPDVVTEIDRAKILERNYILVLGKSILGVARNFISSNGESDLLDIEDISLGHAIAYHYINYLYMYLDRDIPTESGGEDIEYCGGGGGRRSGGCCDRVSGCILSGGAVETTKYP